MCDSIGIVSVSKAWYIYIYIYINIYIMAMYEVTVHYD